MARGCALESQMRNECERDCNLRERDGLCVIVMFWYGELVNTDPKLPGQARSIHTRSVFFMGAFRPKRVALLENRLPIAAMGASERHSCEICT